MITLYQLHWSHFVEKVRWALDYKGLEWSAVDVDAFTKRQMHHLRCKLTLDTGRSLYAVPTIHDDNTDAIVGDSSKILQYLDRTYPTPPLYPRDAGGLPAALNDQRSAGPWPAFFGPFRYLRLRLTCGLGRTACP